MSCANVLPASAVAAWLIESLETIDEMKRSTQPKNQTTAAKQEQATDEEALAGQTLKTAINAWLEAHPMKFNAFADAVGVSAASIYTAMRFVRKDPRARVTTNLVCAFIGIAPGPLFDGEIVKSKSKAETVPNHKHRVLSLAKKIASTDKAEKAAKLLEELLGS